MELLLTPKQKRYLDKKGVISASSLQKAYKKSVEEQRETIQAANKLRASQDKRVQSSKQSVH